MTGRTGGRLRGAADWLLGLLYPHTCPFCEKVTEKPVCGECAGKIAFVEEPRCRKCGKPVREEWMEYCGDCRAHRHYFERGVSLWLHQSPVKESIYRFKYQNRRIYARFYAEQAAQRYGELIAKWRIERLIPIPLHRKRRRERGYNQAELLARELGRILGIPVDTAALVRVRNTAPQKRLDPEQRRKSMSHAFEVSRPMQNTGPILLVDDIYTTGNTLDHAAYALRRAGAGKVYFFTISIGQGY